MLTTQVSDPLASLAHCRSLNRKECADFEIVRVEWTWNNFWGLADRSRFLNTRLRAVARDSCFFADVPRAQPVSTGDSRWCSGHLYSVIHQGVSTCLWSAHWLLFCHGHGSLSNLKDQYWFTDCCICKGMCVVHVKECDFIMILMYDIKLYKEMGTIGWW
jgi:hypothetical protein